jgi:hypothetical protein
MAAMFLDPFLSQMLSETEGEEALEYLKDRTFLTEIRSQPSRTITSSSAGPGTSTGTGASASAGPGTSTGTGASASAGPGTSTRTNASASAGPGTSTRTGASASPAPGTSEDGSSLPKRLRLFNFVKLPDKNSETSEEEQSFDSRFKADTKRVQELFKPIR